MWLLRRSVVNGSFCSKGSVFVMIVWVLEIWISRGSVGNVSVGTKKESVLEVLLLIKVKVI